MLINILLSGKKADDTRLPLIIFAVLEFFARDKRDRRDNARTYWLSAVPALF